MLIGSLYPNPPYAFERMLDLLTRHAHPTLDIARDGAYWRALRVADGLALVKINGRGHVDEPVLDVHLIAQSGVIDAQALLSTVGHVLAIEADRAAFFHMARADSRLWPVVEPLYGLPQLRAANVFEALATTIIEQQIAWVVAQRAQRWLLEWGSISLVDNSERFYAFPSPSQIAAASVAELKPLKITNRRIGLLIAIAQDVVSERLPLEDLARQEPEAGYQRLMQIKGIGHWTATVTLARANGQHHYIAYNDVALQAAVNTYFFGEEGRIPATTVTETLARYDRFAGMAGDYTLARWVLDRY